MKDKIKVIHKSGAEREYAVLATFKYKERNFVLYTDYIKDDNNIIKIHASMYDKDDNLIQITNEEDKKMINQFIKTLEEVLKKDATS